MRERHDTIESPFTVEEDLRFFGMITRGAVVRSGVRLELHGMVTGDLVVQREGQAVIYGTVGGTVRNEGGRVKILGIVNDVADVSAESRTEIDAKAIVRKQQS